jgi:hypothetical protein
MQGNIPQPLRQRIFEEKAGCVMEIRFNVTGEERKALVRAVSEITGWAPVYKGAPGFAFVVNNYIIDRYGTLIYGDDVSEDDARSLLVELAGWGYAPENPFELTEQQITYSCDEQISDNTEDLRGYQPDDHSADESPDDTDNVVVDESPNTENTGISETLTIVVPLEGFTNNAMDNLARLIDGKAALIMKAIGAEDLPVMRTENTLRFPWFPPSSSSSKMDAYTRFINALCDLAKKQTRVTLKETAVESEKFAFRCFLLRLGFIGSEYASARKILLANLSGNGSFKSGDHKS